MIARSIRNAARNPGPGGCIAESAAALCTRCGANILIRSGGIDQCYSYFLPSVLFIVMAAVPGYPLLFQCRSAWRGRKAAARKIIV
jgi:hypothetical protein